MFCPAAGDLSSSEKNGMFYSLKMSEFKCASFRSSSVLQAALEALRSDLTERENNLEREMEALRKAGRDREADLDTLRTVLQSNQDIINVRAHRASGRGLKICVLDWTWWG